VAVNPKFWVNGVGIPGMCNINVPATAIEETPLNSSCKMVEGVTTTGTVIHGDN